MQCQDNSRLRTPLSEVCISTDIGCVPITDGKPNCVVQPDELPIAFDFKTTTLWLFNCSTREWIPFKKFSLDELSALNLDNINNICEVLNIAVWYDPGTAHVQGTITLADLAERILECIKLQTKTLILEGDTLKVWIDGLESLPPFFIKGKNIWFEGGSGTEADPFKVATYDPICQWPNKTQAQVDAASTKMLGACLDGEAVRIPYPKKPCEYSALTEEEVQSSNDKQLIACVDGEAVKVPYPKEPCEYPLKTQEQVNKSTNKQLIACVNGEESKVPYIEAEKPLCELPIVTGEQVSAAGQGATLALCLNGTSSRMPVPSGMFVPEYLCVPTVTDKPVGAPGFGTGPFRFGCNNELYVWQCDTNKWELVTFGNHNDLQNLDPNDVSDPCNNFKVMSWYNAGSEKCVQNRATSAKQLGLLLERCDSSRVTYIGGGWTGGCYYIRNLNGRAVLSIARGEFAVNTNDSAVSSFSNKEWNDVQHHVLEVTNNYPVRSILFTHFRYNIIAHSNEKDDIDWAFGLKVGVNSEPSLVFDWTSGGIDDNSIILSGGNLSKGYNRTKFSDTDGDGEPDWNPGNIISFDYLVKEIGLAPGETVKIYIAPYVMVGGKGTVNFHTGGGPHGYLYRGISGR